MDTVRQDKSNLFTPAPKNDTVFMTHNSNNNNGVQAYPGPAMIRIDGGRIRQLREAKGLTQLYLSTVVGVTTDTISRWENKRYQSIKLENAEKLALALEVLLAEIEDNQARNEQDAPPDAVKEDIPDRSPVLSRPQWIIPLAGVILVLAVGVLVFALLPSEKREPVSATRILPPHVPPGQSFPVIIQVHAPGPEPVALIIKETIPAGSTAQQGVPVITTVDRKNNAIKWISRTAADNSIYAYMCRLSPEVTMGENVVFKGAVTLKQDAGDQQSIQGASTLTIAPYHWADTNQDSMIDDEEILAVYDLYSDIKELPFDRDLIDNIWAGNGYRWDNGSNKYIILQ